MRLAKRKPSLMLILVAALAALLPLLAFLQYRWLGEVSRAERERMQASLKTTASNFSQEFDREITHAYLSFQIDAVALRQRDWQAFAQKFNQWRETSAYPQLVSDILLIEPDPNRNSHLLRFDAATGRFEPADWPAQLGELRAHFEQVFRDEGEAASIKKRVARLPDSVPALVTPIPDAPLTGQQLDTHSISFAGYVVTAFDLGFITDGFIPALAAKYFDTGQGVDYNLTVVTRSDPKKVIYQNQPGALPEVDSADAASSIFGLRIDMPSMIQETLAAQSNSGPGEKQNRISVQVFATGQKTGEQVPKGTRIALMTSDSPRWIALLQHRAGSLDAVVAAARQKNLIISFGMLMLLGASVALIIISTRRAERLARQQIEFVAGVSHEMRTPLAVIRSAGENLADGFVENSEQVRRYGSLIESEGRRLTEMIEQALEFAGIQSGRRSYELQPADLASIVESSVAACAPVIAEGGFEIEKDIEIDLPQVSADRQALSRAIGNLLNNAMKYSGEGRRIKISAQKSAGEKAVEVTIEDQGMGLPQSELSRVFEPFYRGREAVAAQIHGNGLGLSLVKHIVEAHGGRVTLESAPGKGSSFTLHLPAVAEAVAPRGGQAELSPVAKN